MHRVSIDIPFVTALRTKGSAMLPLVVLGDLRHRVVEDFVNRRSSLVVAWLSLFIVLDINELTNCPNTEPSG